MPTVTSQPVPRIFVSATSRDLRTARQLVAEGLRRLECLPIVQDDFPPDYKSVRDMLRTKIQTCNAVVHLAGFSYGAEPQPVLPGPDRRSFTQMEYEIAMELKLPCYVFLCGADFPFDPHDPEPEDKRQLQLAHRERLLQRDELFYELASPEELATRTRELQLSVEGLRKELLRERNRRRLAQGTAAAALVVAIAGGWWLHGRQQRDEAVNVQQTSQLAALRSQLEGPWATVNKVNDARTMLRDQGLTDPARLEKAALALVAAESGRSVADIQQAIATATALTQQFVAIARSEADADPSRRAESQLAEAEGLMKLGESYTAAGDFTQALAAHEKALALLDANRHPVEWMSALIAVAEAQHALGRYADAAAANRRALAFGEGNSALGPDHELTIAASDNVLWYLQYVDQDIPAAEAHARRTLERLRERLGPDAPESIAAVGPLAELTAGAGRFDEAMDLLDDALETSERVSGPDSEATMELVSSLATVADRMDQLKRATSLTRRVVAQREQEYGEGNPATITMKMMLTDRLQRLGEVEEAQEILLEILELQEKELGEEHPDTLVTRESLADTYLPEEDYAAAEEIYREVLAVRERVQGGDHPDTLFTLNSLGFLRLSQDDPAGAVELFRRVFDVQQRTLGPDHAQTIDAAAELGGALVENGDSAAAIPLLRRALASREARTGGDSMDTARACFSLAEALAETDEPEEARRLAERAARIAMEAEDEDAREEFEGLIEQLDTPEER